MLLLALAVCIGLPGCSPKDDVAVDPPNSGKVLQVQTGGPYAYAEIEVADGRRLWVAGAPIAASPGDTVHWGNCVLVRHYHSKTLGRDFAEIRFANSWGRTDRGFAPMALRGTPSLLR